MNKLQLYLYSNQVHYRSGKAYFAPMKNFTDFVVSIGSLDREAILLIPCGHLDVEPDGSGGMLRIDISGNRVIDLPKQWPRYKAPFVTLLSAWRISRRVKHDRRSGVGTVMAGPGPNSFMFWCSLLMPQGTRFAFFIRGDTVETLHNIYKGKLVYPFVMAAVKLFRHRIRRLLSQNRALVFLYGKALSSQYPAEPERVHVITPLIDRSWIRNTARGDVRGGETTFRVLFVGRISPEKNVRNLIEACHLSRDSTAEFCISIVGSGPQLDEMRDLVRAMHLENIVTFFGHVAHGSALTEVFDAHDLLCLPSYTEGTPRCVVEAVARRLPVAATQVGSIHSMFPGHIVPIRGFSPQDIRDAISFAITNYSGICKSTDEAWAGVARFVIDDAARDVCEKLKQMAVECE